jgi:hypothetical protein
MKKFSIFAITLLAASVCSMLGSDLFVTWTNDLQNPVGTQTVVSYGITSGVYTNSITVAYGVSSVTITNCLAGRRYYVAAKAYDGIDYSIYSNEDSAKTKLNTPKNTSVTLP